jgi:hypothetical protein
MNFFITFFCFLESARPAERKSCSYTCKAKKWERKQHFEWSIGALSIDERCNMLQNYDALALEFIHGAFFVLDAVDVWRLCKI